MTQQLGRISGPLLTENLLRNGVNLAFRNDVTTTQLLYLDVVEGKIAVNNDAPTFELDTTGTTQTTNLITPDAIIAGFTVSNSTISAIGDIYLNAADAIVFANLENGTIRISDNIISTINSNADVDITPSGTGTTEIINNLTVFGNIYTPGNITFEGNITLGNANTDDVTFNADINSNIIPDATDTYNLGRSDRRWATLYTNFINGTNANTNELAVGGVNIKHRDGGKLYVAQNGDDTNSGDHILDPFATIAQALQVADASGTQPFLIHISPGEYEEQFPLTVPSNVTVVGVDMRNTIIKPTVATQYNDAFLLNGESTVQNLTIKDFYSILETTETTISQPLVISTPGFYSDRNNKFLLPYNFVSSSGNYAIVGRSAAGTGSAEIYNVTTGQLLHTLSDPAAGDYWGQGVAIDGNYAVVTDYVPRYNGLFPWYTSVISVFDVTTGNLLRSISVDPNAGTGSGLELGPCVDISGNYVILGGDQSAKIYNITTGNLVHNLVKPALSVWFGQAVAISGNYAVVSDPQYSADRGRAYVYNVTTGLLIRTISSPSSQTDNYFGGAVSTDGIHVIIGAPRHDTPASFSGIAYIFNIATGNLVHTLANPGAAPSNDFFGAAVSLDGNYAVVGAYNTGFYSGTVYLFDVTTGDLVLTWDNPNIDNILSFPGRGDADWFGTSVSLSGNTIMAAGGDNGGTTFIASIIEPITTSTLHYAFKFAPNAIISTRSPYVQNVTVITKGSIISADDPRGFNAGNAGGGAYIDGNSVNSASNEASMLFHSVTFITPGVDAVTMTNGVRVEWLNSFTYFANRGLYAVDGVDGHLSTDGSTVKYGAELRSIGSANVYGNYGAVADGVDTLMYLIQHNFGYIGNGKEDSNNPFEVIQSNEVIESNSGKIHYVTTNHSGNFRVGDNFLVDFETGNTSLNIESGAFDSADGVIIRTGQNDTTITSTKVETGNIRFTQNFLDSIGSDLNVVGSTGTINLQDNTSVSGNINIRDNFSFGGTLNLAGDQDGRETDADRLTFNVEFEQDFVPHTTSKFNLGEVQRYWLNAYLDRLEVGNLTIDGNIITSNVSSADLELRANGSGKIYVPSNNVQIDNDLTVSGATDLQDLAITGLLTQSGDRIQTGNYEQTGDLIADTVSFQGDIQFTDVSISGNVITTTIGNNNLELGANGAGTVFVPNNNVIVRNNLDVGNIFNNNNINVTLQTQFNEADVSDITITQNYITTNNGNLDLLLRANGTGVVNVQSNLVIDNELTTNGSTTLKDSFFTYEYGPELVVNGTFNTNLIGWDQTGGGTATVTVGNLRINATGAARNVSQEITVEVGKTYDFTTTFKTAANANTFYLRIFESGVGTLVEWNETTGLVNGQILTASFVPQTTAIDIIFRAVDNIVEWDNVSLIEDIGLVESITPIQVNILGNTTQTGNVVQTGNLTQSGDSIVEGNLTVSNEITTTNFNINENVIQNYREDLRLDPSNPYDPLSLPQIVKAMQQSGATADDYVGQTEKNLIVFLANGTSVPYANSYIDVDNSGVVTSSDALAWLQYVANGATPNSVVNQFIFEVVELLLEDEFANPGKYNSNIFLGDYHRADFKLQAAGTGKVTAPANDVRVANNLFAGSINAANIEVAQSLALNELIITDSIIEIDDNFISTTISNANLELRSTRNIVIPTSSVILSQDLTLNGLLDIDNSEIVGNITQFGNRFQLGNLNIVGTVTVSTSNIKSEIQFDDIVFNDNYIETTNSNANLELLANSNGLISIPFNNVEVSNNINLGNLNSSSINIDASLSAEVFELSSNINIFDNVITTTISNSNLELRSVDSNVIIENLIVNDNNISTSTSSINLVPTNNLIINSSSGIKLPVGTTNNRQTSSNNIRFNNTNNVFEAFNNTAAISFNGIYSSTRRAHILAHPTDNSLNITVNNTQVGTVNSNGISLNGLTVDDISVQNDIIRTTVSNSDLELRAHGNGVLRLYSTDVSNNTIQNNSNTALIIKNTGFGKVKFVDTSAVRIPAGTTAERPSTPETGMMRWNTEIDVLETWDGNTFITAAGEAATISAVEMENLILEYTLIFG